MSGAARSVAYQHLQRALARWPRDPLRPDCQLQDVLARRLEKQAAAGGAFDEQAELQQANALYTLLENRYKNKYRIQKLLAPASKPSYYADLLRELEEAPKRTWLQRLGKRLGGMIRLQ
ncbi:hypothetical protein VTK73DRAFT_6011 [Phialemonium thermophilum]|uniref:Uncharacterized protein n=1 Tax=Phialemonium thermophilum TaxID=223376 RepID=A0ABR3V053_9PEZI